MMNPQNGKGSKRLHARTKKSHEEMQSNWDKAFKKKDKQEDLDKEKCIETYLKIHVSQLHLHTEKIQDEWKKGRNYYTRGQK